MKLDWLAGVLRREGLLVQEHDGWESRTNWPFMFYHPAGLINHHTAGSAVLTGYPGPPWYRNSALETKCNITIRGDGVVAVLNAGYAYDSGSGAPEVLDAVRNDRPLPNLSGLRSTKNGNAWFIDIEVQHLGNGDPIHPPQREALIRTNKAICEQMGWNPLTRVIGHREWAPDRKVDPRWDGFANPMPQIRRDTYDLIEQPEEDDMLTKYADERVWRNWYTEGVTGPGTLEALLKYWVTDAAARTDAEHAEATMNILARKVAKQSGMFEISLEGTATPG